jgi:hypothetical protein
MAGTNFLFPYLLPFLKMMWENDTKRDLACQGDSISTWRDETGFESRSAVGDDPEIIAVFPDGSVQIVSETRFSIVPISD